MSTQEPTIGSRLKEVRVGVGLKQADFAESLGVVTKTIGRYELDETIPDGVFLLRLQSQYGIDPTWLLLGKECDEQARCDASPYRRALTEMRRILDQLDLND